jgi:preprotein translocase subunit SecF
MEILKNSNIDFMSKRKYFYVVSCVVILAGLVSLIVKGGPKLSIDFTGGTLVQLSFAQKISNPELRSGLKQLGFENAEIQTFVGNNDVSFRLQESNQVTNEKIYQLKDILKKNFVIQKIEVVGPAVGTWLLKRAVLAFCLAFLGIIIYVAIRFKGGVWGYSAVIADIHDILVVVGVFSLLNKEISLTVVAALMTIAGYSVNDTIVTYDRIRENMRSRYKESPAVVMNDSINQTLSRTIITNLCTFFAVLALLFFGGETLRDFSLAMFIGMVAGTYSTIFIAVPIILDLKHKKNSKNAKK